MDEWERVANVNLNGTFNVTRLAVFIASSSAKMISGATLPIDEDRQTA
jgi:NAD(P)-dependent dehydrogenase (short-subunit alcohol dehydrogenase family)